MPKSFLIKKGCTRDTVPARATTKRPKEANERSKIKDNSSMKQKKKRTDDETPEATKSSAEKFTLSNVDRNDDKGKATLRTASEKQTLHEQNSEDVMSKTSANEQDIPGEKETLPKEYDSRRQDPITSKIDTAQMRHERKAGRQRKPRHREKIRKTQTSIANHSFKNDHTEVSVPHFETDDAVQEEKSTKLSTKIDKVGQAYTCTLCGRCYATSSNLSRHKQTHRSLDSKQAKACSYCGKRYVSMPALSMHVLTHKRSHACNMCGKRFSRPWLLQGHLRSHTGERPFRCAQCDKSFADRSNLRAHEQTHSPLKQHKCERCHRTFALKSYLTKHLESTCFAEKGT